MPFLPLKSCIHHYVWSFTTTWHCKLQTLLSKKNLQKSSLLTFPDLYFQQKINPTLVFQNHRCNDPSFRGGFRSIQCEPGMCTFTSVDSGLAPTHTMAFCGVSFQGKKKNIQQPVWGRDISEGLFDGIMCEMCEFLWHVHMDVSKNRGTPKSSMLIFNRVLNHRFWGTPICGNTHIDMWHVWNIRIICCVMHLYINLLVLVHGMGLDFKISPKFWGEQFHQVGQNYGGCFKKTLRAENPLLSYKKKTV